MTTKRTYKVHRDIFTSTKPNYYQVNKHQDLFDLFKNGLLTNEEYRGFLKGCLYKYTFRGSKKNQLQADRNKAVIYAKELRDFDTERDVSNAKN